MEKNFISTLKQRLQTPKKAVIIPHKNPDGDALGSTLAWMHFLLNENHEALIISPNDYPKFLNWLPGQEQILIYNQKKELAEKKIEEADLIFTLDFNALSRIDTLGDLVSNAKAEKVMIDHHESPEDYAELMYSDPQMSSTCEMIYRLITELNSKGFTQEIASCLYTGIMTDTGSFRYPSTTAETHKAIAKLVESGADGTAIHQNIYDSSSFNRLKLLGIALSNLNQIESLPVVFITLKQAELNSCDYQKGDTEGFVNYGLSLKGVQFACIMIENEKEGKIKMSFRSKGSFSVNEFARTYFEGGGHHNAAGGMSKDSMEKTVHRFKTAVAEIANQF
jgi:phosphoesterase RecJ-like protein